MGRRTVDEETAAIATERLARLLGELTPRRALGPPGDAAEVSSGTSDPPVPAPVRQRDRAPAVPERPPPPVGEPEPVGGAAQPSRTSQLGAFGRRHLGVIAVLLVIGIGAAGWGLLRARPIALAAPLSLNTMQPGNTGTGNTATGNTGTGNTGTGNTGTGSTTATAERTPAAASSPASGSPAAAAILVHVVGAVRRPGVVTLPDRARVQDAIRAAGGLTPTARPGELNLAQVLTDGEQIVIGSARDPGGEVRDGTTSGAGGDGASGGETPARAPAERVGPWSI